LEASNAKVVEFRDNNIKHLQELGELRPLKVKLDGVDIDAAKAALTKVKDLENKGITKPDDIAAQIKASVEAALAPVQAELKSFQDKAADADKRANDAVKRSAIGEKFAAAGGEPTALDFILSKSAGKFVIEGGVLRAAQNVFSTDKPGEPLSVEEWLTQQTKESPFAFKLSTGGGAETGPKGTIVRPAGQNVIKDPTPQQLGDPKNAKAVREGTLRYEYTS
ncbi:MAG TPA: hypothetical protein VK575_11790, partial [Gemmatimonadaceae bacterium]|nr:hypothetical protein [Gemmatimonadaceae bacterium]